MTVLSDVDSERNAKKAAVELVADLWFIVMSHLSPSDVVSLSQTCKALYEYSQFHHVWHGALLEHRFLPKSYPHLRSAPTDVIRRQLLTTARLDAAFAQGILRPIRSYSFPIDFPGVFQGMKFIPGTKWLVLLFHSRTLNPARHSNICLFKPPIETSGTDSSMPSSVTLQSEWCWLHLGQRDGPYKSSRGHDLMLFRTFVKNERTFAICHLDTKTPSIKIPFMVQTTCRARNYVAAGDYFVYGWISEERKHMVRIMKLNEDYTKPVNDVTLEIDCPAGNDGRLMVRYDLRLSGKRPGLLFISTRLMAAYDISDSVLTSASPSSSVKLQPTWKYLPENISFGRILRVFPEGAIVTMYEGKIKFIYPDLECAQPNSKTVAMYKFSSPTPYSTEYPAVFASQRIFWPLRFPRAFPASAVCNHLIETATLPEPKNEECLVDRVPVDHDDLSLAKGNMGYDAQDWDELTGKLCVRYVRSKFPHDDPWRKMSWRITIVEMV